MKLIEKLEESKKNGSPDNIEGLEYKVKCMEQTILKMDETINEFKRIVSRMKSNVDAHINRQFTEIKVMEKDDKWGDYSGTFYISSDDEREMVLEKARTHFNKHFKDGMHHQDKKLGLFLFSPRSGNQLVEEMITTSE